MYLFCGGPSLIKFCGVPTGPPLNPVLVVLFAAAKLGEVCYSDAHCTLSGEKSRCQFTIPGVFGFCVCDPPGSRVDCSMTVAGQDPAAALIRPNNSAFKYPFGKPDPKKKVPYQKRTTTTSTTTSAPSTTDAPAVKPFRPSQLQLPFKWPGLKANATNDAASKVTTTLAATPPPVKLYLKNPLKDTQNKSQAAIAVGDKTPNKMHKKPPGGSTSGKSELGFYESTSGPLVNFSVIPTPWVNRRRFGIISVFRAQLIVRVKYIVRV